jgi:hypothetical protein
MNPKPPFTTLQQQALDLYHAAHTPQEAKFAHRAMIAVGWCEYHDYGYGDEDDDPVMQDHRYDRMW